MSIFSEVKDCIVKNKKNVSVSSLIQPGSLIRFNYLFAKPNHDQTPLVLIVSPLPYTDKRNNQVYIRGININYLTFPIIKNLLQSYAENVNFSYQNNLKGNKYILSAFRQYRYDGINSVKKLNSLFLLNVLACARSVDPTEIEAIRSIIKEQIKSAPEPK